MAFNWLGTFRTGAWKVYRNFVLNEQRDILNRIKVLDVELSRIGQISILYKTVDTSVRDDIKVLSSKSEERLGFVISPVTSSLAKLIQAYIALGGNPFDISMFLEPQISATAKPPAFKAEFDENNNLVGYIENQPYGGILWPIESKTGELGISTGGWLPLWRYPPRKFGNTLNYAEENSKLGRTVEPSRRWVDQTIRFKRDNLENQIVKLMDLREQLTRERDEVFAQVSGGVIPTLEFTDFFFEGARLPRIINLIDQAMYDLDEDGVVNLNAPRKSSIDPPFPSCLEDASTGEEDWTAFG